MEASRQREPTAHFSRLRSIKDLGENTRSSEVWRNHDVRERDVIPDPPPVGHRVSHPRQFSCTTRLLPGATSRVSPFSHP